MGLLGTIDWTVDHGLTVGPQVYLSLRERIIRAELEPGVLVSEAEIARAFGLSRQPVREAFIKLADDGLVEIRPQRGTFVRRINLSSVMDARFVREAVEADICRLAGERPSSTLVSELRRQIDRQRDVAERRPEDFMALDDAFHRSLATAAGKAQVFKLVDNVKVQMDRVRHLTLMHRSVVMLSIDQHERVVDAIARASPEEAAAAMRSHLRQILADLPQVARQRPEFFEKAPD